jgi:hypothetical protein
MTLKLPEAICLSLAGGFAIVAPPSFPRNRTQAKPAEDAPPRAEHAASDPAQNDDAPNKRARSRSRKTS